MRKEKKVGMPHNFHLSMSVSWTIKSKEHAGCYSKLKKKRISLYFIPEKYWILSTVHWRQIWMWLLIEIF